MHHGFDEFGLVISVQRTGYNGSDDVFDHVSGPLKNPTVRVAPVLNSSSLAQLQNGRQNQQDSYVKV
jgi:hypothetical protein